ncbi:MAG TPA: DUF5694 domain-containing protein [Gammaproteobacteria bacterium]
MKNRFHIYGLSALLGWSATALAGQSLPVLDQHLAGPRTQVLVLGTMHLSQLPKGFKPESLAPVLAKLAAYKPDIITIEALSGVSCDLMARQPAVYDPQGVAYYCHSTAAAKAATGLDVYAATGEAVKSLASWPAQPAPAQRRHLAALFLASGDGTSALVQWLQLPQTERHAGDGLDDTLAAALDGLETKQNEDYLIAARLAAQLGLQRVYPVDDHTGDNITIDDEAAYDKAIQAAWDKGHAAAKPMRDQEAALEKSGDLLAAYRFIDRPDNMQLAIQSDFGQALKDPSPGRYGRLYVGGWETRNLRMAANVHEAFREHPGVRVLCIVGASHKPWFDGLLGQMQGVDVVDVEKVLGPAD